MPCLQASNRLSNNGFSRGKPCIYRLVCFGLFDRKTVQKPSEFAPGYLFYLIRILRPPEMSFLQTFIIEPESVIVPLQNLDLIAVFVAKGKHRPAERIQLEMLFHHAGKAVNRLAHIGCATSQINDVGSADFYHGVCTAESTSRKVTASNPAGTSTTISWICMSRFPVTGLDRVTFFSRTAGTFAQIGDPTFVLSLLVNAARSLSRFFQYFIRS